MAILQHKPNDVTEAIRKLSPMVYKMAHKFVRNHRGNDFDDVAQQGFMGVVEAYNRYKPEAGMAFSSYCYTWIWALMIENRKKAYKVYNSTSSKSLDDAMSNHSYEMPLDAKIDADRVVERMDTTTRAIHRARQEGYTYAAIADVLTKHGKPCTLHQVRRQHLQALEVDT